jgi:hypothetical protein
MMKKYNVCIERDCVEAVEIEVLAENETEAGQLALVVANTETAIFEPTDYLGDLRVGFVESAQ